MTALLIGFLGALPDIRAEEQDLIASDDLVVIRLLVTATHKGDLVGIPATGRGVQWNAIDIYRVTDDGKISEEWAFDDMATVANQLGAVSLPWASRPSSSQARRAVTSLCDGRGAREDRRMEPWQSVAPTNVG
jgi:hypothetical protein